MGMERFLAELSRAAEERRAGRLRKLQKKKKEKSLLESLLHHFVSKETFKIVSSAMYKH